MTLKRDEDIVRVPGLACYFDLAHLILILYLGQAILRCVSDLTWFGPFWLTGGRLDSNLFGQPLSGIGPLIILFPLFIWPGIVKLWESRMVTKPCPVISEIISEPRPWVLKVIAVLALTLWAITVFFVLRNKGISEAFFKVVTVRHETDVVSQHIDIGAALPLALAALLLSCVWLSYEIYGRASAVLRAFILMIALLVVLAIDLTIFRYRLLTALIVIFAVPFVFAFVRIIFPVVTSLSFKEWWVKLGLPTRISFIFGSCLLILLLVRRGEESRNIASWSLIASFTWALSRLGIFLLLLMLLRILKHVSASARKGWLPESAVNTGIVLALTFFFLPSQHWLYLPIVFLLGYALLRWWTLVPRPLFEFSSKIEVLQQSVRDRIHLNDAIRGLRATRKELLGRLSKGEIDYSVYSAKVGNLEAFVEQKRGNLILSTGQKREEALAVGAVVTPWERGKTGALHGLIFGMPWIILFFSNLQKSEAPDINAEVLSIITSGLLAIAQWPLQGFFFGYFYPYLRGNDGVRKGLYFFLTIFIPTFVATVIAKSMSGEVWATFFLWSLQLFIQCMLLGLISGDYETLRRAGLSWRHLIDVHNLGSLVAWGSSVIVAAGAAITTLLTSGAASLISSSLKALIPELQQVSK